MIVIEPHGTNRCQVFHSDINIGFISIRCNPYHAQNYYLDLELKQYDLANAKELFRLLRLKLSRPLQVMLYSREIEKSAFLLAGGFQKRRQCFEMDVSTADLKAPINDSIPIIEVGRGDPAYRACCGLLYSSYRKNHEAINPLTATKELFYRKLPDTVIFQQENGDILNFAFIEENEIAYIGTSRQSYFHDFAQTLLSRMLTKYNSVSFECDSCDPVAMELRTFFDLSNMDSYDTYILN